MWRRLAARRQPPRCRHVARLVLLVHACPSRAVHALWTRRRGVARRRGLVLLKVGEPVAVLRDRLLCVDLPLGLVRSSVSRRGRLHPILVAAHRASRVPVRPVPVRVGGGGDAAAPAGGEGEGGSGAGAEQPRLAVLRPRSRPVGDRRGSGASRRGDPATDKVLMERESEVSKVLFVSGWEVVAGPVVPLFDGRLALKKPNNEEEASREAIGCEMSGRDQPVIERREGGIKRKVG